MSLTINTNISGLIAQSSLKSSTISLNNAIERMTTGFKINNAKDNAAGYSIANNMSVKLSSYDIAVDNVSLGVNLLDTASSSVELVSSHLQRIRDLSEQAANGTYGEESLRSIQAEIEARILEIDRVMSTTEYNGIKLFSGIETNINDGSGEDIYEANRVLNQTTFVSGETYYLTDVNDLLKLEELVNSGENTVGVTFELLNNIDMDGVSFRGIGDNYANRFRGTFDGNGHIISNLTINSSGDAVGLFGVSYGTIRALGLENCDITGNNEVGGITGGNAGSISECYVSGSINGNSFVGGLVGNNTTGTISKSYSNSSVTGTEGIGGLVGSVYSGSNISECYATGGITGTNYIGGLVGYADQTPNISGYFDLQSTGQSSGIGVGNYSGTVSGVNTSELENLINQGVLPCFDYGVDAGGDKDESVKTIVLQVGIDSTDNSKISFDTDFTFGLFIDVTVENGAKNAIGDIDEILDIVSKKQTEFGSIQNRLDSVLDSLSISIENLTSSLSTIKDADIAEESSSYIKSQILQQASATLLSTANQNPSIALQLV